jgi:hypothetical protein
VPDEARYSLPLPCQKEDAWGLDTTAIYSGYLSRAGKHKKGSLAIYSLAMYSFLLGADKRYTLAGVVMLVGDGAWIRLPVHGAGDH